MIEWTRLSRGTLRYRYNGLTADVWAVGGGALWNVLDEGSGVYVASGQTPTLDDACEAALLAMQA